MRKLMRVGARAAKSLAGPTTLAARFVARVATQSASMAMTSTTGFLKWVRTIDRVPDGLAVDDGGRAGDRHADEAVEGHRGGEAEGLSQHLIALGAGVAGEVRDVERERGPEADHAGEGGDEEFVELTGLGLAGGEGARLGEDRAETARRAVGPDEQRQAKEDEQRGLDGKQEADAVDAPVDDEDVDRPEAQEADELRGVDVPEDRQDRRSG